MPNWERDDEDDREYGFMGSRSGGQAPPPRTWQDDHRDVVFAVENVVKDLRGMAAGQAYLPTNHLLAQVPNVMFLYIDRLDRAPDAQSRTKLTVAVMQLMGYLPKEMFDYVSQCLALTTKYFRRFGM